VIIGTRWAEYGDVAGLATSEQTVFDARRMLEPESVRAGYLTVGRRMTASA
jgi:hypothetical protein